jgi:hypothetical protein
VWIRRFDDETHRVSGYRHVARGRPACARGAAGRGGLSQAYAAASTCWPASLEHDAMNSAAGTSWSDTSSRQSRRQ